MRWMKSLLLALPLLFAADAVAGEASCDSPCYITVCDSAGNCTVYECDTESCRIVAIYQRQKSLTQGSSGKEEKKPLTISVESDRVSYTPVCAADSLCPVKICEGPMCVLWGLRNGEFTILDATDNPDHVFGETIRRIEGEKR